MTLGEKLKKIRQERLGGKGLRKIAKEVNTDYAYLSRIERGVVIPSARLLQKIVKAYKLTDSEKQEIFLLASRLPPGFQAKLKRDQNIKEILKFFRSLKML